MRNLHPYITHPHYVVIIRWFIILFAATVILVRCIQPGYLTPMMEKITMAVQLFRMPLTGSDMGRGLSAIQQRQMQGPAPGEE